MTENNIEKQSKLEHRALINALSYDPLTGDLVWVERASGRRYGKLAGSFHKATGYRVVVINNMVYKYHRLAWFHYHGVWPLGEIDHKNGIRDDNRINNLVDVRRIDNQRNRKLLKNNTSGVTGVYWHKRNVAWVARIKYRGKYRNLGSFKDIGDAVLARLGAEKEYGFSENHGRLV